MSTSISNDLCKPQKKSRDHTLTRVRNNQRRCRERRRQYIATLEQKVEETERLLDEARAEIASLKYELIERRAHRHHPHHHHHQLTGASGESLNDSDSINSAALMISSDERGGHRQMSGNNEEERELPFPLPLPADDILVGATFHGQTADAGYNILSKSLSLQQVENIPSKQHSFHSSALTSPCEAAVCECAPPDAILPQTVATTTTPSPASLGTVSTPTLTALQLQGLILPTLPVSSNCLYTVSPVDESTTPCSQAFVFISQQNFKGIDASVIERWLSRGFRQARDPREGCRVENNLLFQLLDFISDP